jgi:tetratricopeptide (TPR) repeat protein
MSAMGDDESALKVYQASLEINKLNIDSLFGIGEIMIRGEQYELGKEYLQQVLAVYPDHQDAIELLNSLEDA